MFKKFFSALLCTVMLFCTAISVSAAELKAGDIAYVIGNYDLFVAEIPTENSRYELGTAYRGAKVTVLETNITGEYNKKFHKVRLADGTEGYVWAEVNKKETLEAAET